MAEDWRRGGILALVRLDRETGGALTADMMERLGCSLVQAPFLYGWHAVATWARHLPQDSAVWRARHPEEAAFASDYQRAIIAADTFDAVMRVIGTIAAAHGTNVRDPQPYPRPHDGRKTEHFGSGGIPVSEFEAWYYAEE